MRRFVLAAVLAMAACAPDAPRDPEPPYNTGHFFGHERFTLIGEIRGTQTGSFTEHVRDWGAKRATMETISIDGQPPYRTHSINVGGESIGIDPVTREGTIARLPRHQAEIDDAVATAREGQAAQQILGGWGGRATGERGMYAGLECAFWEVAHLGLRTCITSWGATLYERYESLGVDRVVTEVRLGDGEPDDAFAYDESRLTRVEIPTE